MGTQAQPDWKRRKSNSGLKKFLLLVVVVLGVYAGWGIWQDYRSVGYFDLGRSIGVGTELLVDLPQDLARVSTEAFRNLGSSSAESGNQFSRSDPQERPQPVEVSNTEGNPDLELPPTEVGALNSPGIDPSSAGSPVSSNADSAPLAASSPSKFPDRGEARTAVQQQSPPGPSSTTSSGTLNSITVWDSNTNRDITLNPVEFAKFQSNQSVPSSASARNRSSEAGNSATYLPSSAGFELDYYVTYALGLINKAREEHGLSPVQLGSNTGAQGHSVAMLTQNFVGHWGTDGLNPDMRYTLAGGSGLLEENVANLKQQPYTQYKTVHPLEALLATHENFMENPLQRRKILNPWHTHVNIGLACDHVTCAVTQDFERNFITFAELPVISDGVLTFSGQLNDRLAFASVEIWYHQPPHSLTLGQLDATDRYYPGQQPATFLLDPPSPGHFYSTEELQPTSFTWETDIDPYQVDPESSRSYWPSGSPDVLNSHSKMVPMTIARVWETRDSYFRIEANLSDTIEALGPGVYTLYIWGSEGTNKIRLTNYTIFVD